MVTTLSVKMPHSFLCVGEIHRVNMISRTAGHTLFLTNHPYALGTPLTTLLLLLGCAPPLHSGSKSVCRVLAILV